MAVNKVPVLKRCRSLGLEPSYLGYDKKSKRNLQRGNRKVSEYGLQLRDCLLYTSPSPRDRG